MLYWYHYIRIETSCAIGAHSWRGFYRASECTYWLLLEPETGRTRIGNEAGRNIK
jgi:hypothetical protein